MGLRDVPKLRFPGFTDAWEQHKCGDVLIERNIQHPQSKDYPLVSFTVENGVTPKTDRYEREQLVKGDKAAKKYKETRFDDIVYNPANLKFGAIARNKFGNAVFSPIYITFEVNKDFAIPSFIEMFVTRNSFIQNALQYQQGTVYERMAVNTDDFANLEIMLPSKEEQYQIGELFDSIDKTITLHQRKCDDLKKMKKGMLQKMFPKEGENAPEIRFPGFIGAWEQRKLGDVFLQTSNFVNPEQGDIELWSLTVDDGLTPKTDRYERGFLVKKEDNFKLVRPGDIVYNPMNMTLGAVGYNEMSKTVAVSGYYTTMVTKEGYDAGYIKTWLKSPQAILLYKSYATGTLIEKQRVQFPTLCSIPTLFPSAKEQEQIGNFFSELDKTITLHQRKCDEFKNMKQALLQQMFV